MLNLQPSSRIGSSYSLLYKTYLRNQFKQVEGLLRNIEFHTNCGHYRLRYPLLALLKAVSKKLLLNSYECIVFGYLLSVISWEDSLNCNLIKKNKYNVPDVIYINDPTDYSELKCLTLFLYLNCYTVKEFLNEDNSIILKEMQKLIPHFQNLYYQWLNSQSTTQQKLDPKQLNNFFKKISCQAYAENYNEMVDKILHISPCYDVELKIINKQVIIDKKRAQRNPNLLIFPTEDNPQNEIQTIRQKTQFIQNFWINEIPQMYQKERREDLQ